MTSDSPNKDRDMNERAPDPRHPRSYWEYDGETESVREMGPTPLGIAWSGVVLAAACYPIVLGVVELVRIMIAYGIFRISLNEFGLVFVFVLVYGLSGLIYGIIMSIPAVLLTRLLGWCLTGIVSKRGTSGIYGGMTGFLCLSGGGLFFVHGILPIRNGQQLFFLWFAPLLAIVMGYAGAILAGYRRRNDGFPFFEPIFSFEKQITIVFLLKLTFIVAALSAVLKAAGLAGLYVGITWLIYFLVQTLLLVIDHWITRWLSRG